MKKFREKPSLASLYVWTSSSQTVNEFLLFKTLSLRYFAIVFYLGVSLSGWGGETWTDSDRKDPEVVSWPVVRDRVEDFLLVIEHEDVFLLGLSRVAQVSSELLIFLPQPPSLLLESQICTSLPGCENAAKLRPERENEQNESFRRCICLSVQAFWSSVCVDQVNVS